MKVQQPVKLQGRGGWQPWSPMTRLSAILLWLIVSLLLSGCATTSHDSNAAEPQPKPTLVGQDPFAVAKLADDAYAKSQWLEAQRHYKTLTELVPDDAYAWFRMANTHIRQGEITQSIHAYEEALRRDPQYPKAWYNLATAYLLNAQHALRQTWNNLRPEDPGRKLALGRLQDLDRLIYQRLEETDSPIAAQSALPLPDQSQGSDNYVQKQPL